jgi:hypothetical protein
MVFFLNDRFLRTKIKVEKVNGFTAIDLIIP